MCFPKAPKVETPPPPPQMEQAVTDDLMDARQDERKRMKGAINARSTILSEGSGGNGRYKTLLGQ